MPADVVKHATIAEGMSRVSTASYPQGYNELRANVYVYNSGASIGDNYTTGYSKRINYYLKEMKTNAIVTQGTLYSWTEADNYRVSYTVQVPYVNGDYRLFMESPTLKSTGHCELTMFA
ncbi:hypothetical protein Bfsp1_21 [Cytobacillus phage Bfsp1]|nr:hypothetical protein Bfsp1_21 [Cytobacillus phage Bfsp1]